MAWSLVLGLMLGGAVVPNKARAQDEEDKNSIWNLDKRIFESVAKGFGMQKDDSPGIYYRERSPLVVPPTRNLPPPEAEGTKRNAAWPVDPDAKRRAERSGSKKKLDSRGFDDDYQMRPLTPSELNPAGVARPRTTDNKPAQNGDPDGKTERPSELGYLGGLFSWQAFGFGPQKQEYGNFTKEPPRQSLTAPPIGYQTPSSDQPYGISPEKSKPKVIPLDPAVGNL